MQYVMLFHENVEAIQSRDHEFQQAYWAAWGAYSKALTEAGVSLNGAALQPPHTATTVRLKDGQRQVQDGPYAEAKEQLGGYILIEVENLDEALDWAARCPVTADGAVEVRPVMPVLPMNEL
ncbi:MAG: YciI family protein [Thermostichus sp. BF3_bins_97]